MLVADISTVADMPVIRIAAGRVGTAEFRIPKAAASPGRGRAQHPGRDRASGRIWRNRSAVIRWVVSGFSGQCSETTSLSASSLSSETNSTPAECLGVRFQAITRMPVPTFVGQAVR